MPGVKTNEVEGTRAVLRYCRMSAYKAREVLDLIRGQDVARAAEILRFSERDAARVIGKLLDSAVANARNNDELDPDELFVSTAYADEGATIKRWRPRARGRATRIRKRTCHITVIVSRMPEDRLERQRARQAAELALRRARRVAGQRQSEARRRDRSAGEEAEVAAEAAEVAAEAAEAAAEQGIVDDQAVAVAMAEADFAETKAARAETEAVETEAAETEAPGAEIEAEAPEAEAAAAETEAPEAKTEPTEEEGS